MRNHARVVYCVFLPPRSARVEEEERDNAYDKAGFLSFMEYGGFDLRQVGY